MEERLICVASIVIVIRPANTVRVNDIKIVSIKEVLGLIVVAY